MTLPHPPASLHRLSIACLAAVGLSSTALAISPDTTDARAIMAAVEERETGDRTTFQMSMTITDKAGRNRTRVVQVRTMRFDGGTKQLILFEEPADLRNAGFLSVDYADGDRADDQWLYLPSLGKTTRIASADKSSSFMGTDLTYADMTQKDPDDYDYVLLEQSVDVEGTEAWLIGATPRNEQEIKETGYAKSQVWVAKDSLLPIQVKAWVIDGQRYKYTKLGDIREIDGVPVAHEVVVRTVKDGEVESTSTLITSGLKMDDPSVSESDFNEQRLEQGL